MNSTLMMSEIVLPSELAALYMIMSILIIITNILTLLVFKSMKSLQLQHYLMICLAAVDLSTVLPHIVGFICLVRGFLSINEILCKTISISNHSVVGLTTWIHCAIRINKCVSILKPMSHREFVLKYKPSHLAVAFSLSAFALILAIMIAAVIAAVIEPAIDPVLGSCMFTVDFSYVALVGGIFIVIPLLVAIITHTMILIELRKSEFRRKRKIIKSMKTVVFVVGIYYLCWVPFLVDMMWTLFALSQPPPIFSWVAVNFIIANSSMNFFIHFKCSKKFKSKCQSLFSVSCIESRVYPKSRSIQPSHS